VGSPLSLALFWITIIPTVMIVLVEAMTTTAAPLKRRIPTLRIPLGKSWLIRGKAGDR